MFIETSKAKKFFDNQLVLQYEHISQFDFQQLEDVHLRNRGKGMRVLFYMSILSDGRYIRLQFTHFISYEMPILKRFEISTS